jgi:GAF domain-containing protein
MPSDQNRSPDRNEGSGFVGAGPRPAMDPQAAIAELGRLDLREHDLDQVLKLVGELAKASIPGAAEVSVSLLNGEVGSTPAFTGPLALDCDEAQYANNDGPCVHAAQSGGVVLVQDLITEERWPHYTPHAVAVGVRASLSVALPVQAAVVGALNIYATVPHAFPEDAVELARTFAGYAAVAVANAHLYATTAALAQNMQDAMATRAVIEQAKGLIMGELRCSAEEAFDVLVRASSRGNQKLRDIATEMVDNARRPR